MKHSLSLLASLWCFAVVYQTQAGVECTFGVENLMGRTSSGSSLSSMQVRVGKFTSGFTPTRTNYDQWLANFIPLTPATESLTADLTSFLTPAVPDTGPWRMTNNSLTIEAGSEPAGFIQGDQLYIWLANSTVSASTTEAALLTHGGWVYTAPTAQPQPAVSLALQGASPTVIVGRSFDDDFQDGASETGVHLVTRRVPPAADIVAGELAFDVPSGNVFVIEGTSGDVTVNLPITRSGGADDDVEVTVSTANGTAQAPVDYDAVTNAVVSFPDTVTDGQVILTIHSAGGAEANEAFTVTLANPTNGATLGAMRTVTVHIVDSVTDITPPPSPGITDPVANALVNPAMDGTYTLKGTATDNRGVKSVEVTLNGSGPFAATLATPGKPSSTWTLSLPVLTGTNTLSVVTKDTRDQVSVNPTTRSFRIARPLAVNVMGSTYGAITAGFVSSSYREVGKSYTIVATPKATTSTVVGGIFTGWTIGGVDVANGNTPLTNLDANRLGVTGPSLEKNSLTFIFREGMTLTATFIENPYNSTVTGSYNGLIKPSATLPDRPTGTDGTVTSNSSEGHFNATVQNTGGFSGKLTIDGFVLNIAGNFDHLGRARFGTAKLDTLIVPRTNKPSLYLKLYIGLTGVTLPSPLVTPAVGKILGEVSATEFKKSEMAAVSTFSADRAYYTGLTGPLTVPDEYLTVTGTAPSPTGRTDGTFTVVLESVPLASQPARIQSVFSAGDYPQGAGYGTLKVTKAGLVTLSGSLSDGTPLAASGPLSQDNRVALFAQLYNKLGFYSVEVKLDSTQANTDMAVAATTEALWARPFIGTSHYYPYGWPEVLKSDFKGAKFIITSGESVLRAPDDGDGDTVSEVLLDPTPDGNASLTFSDGQLSEDLVKVANISTTDGVVKVPDNDPTFTLSLTRTTGVVSGTLVHTDDTTVNFKGTVYQKGATAGGYGFFQTKQPTVIDYTGESGGFTLIGQPKP